MQLHSDHMNHGFGGTGGCWGTQLVPSYPLHLRLSAWRASQEKQGPRIFILSLLSLITVVVGGKTYHIWLIDKHHHFETLELTLVKNDLHGAFNTVAHPPPPLGCDRELWKEIPLERNPVHHDLGGKRVTLPHDYAIRLINIHKTLFKSTIQNLLGFQLPQEHLAPIPLCFGKSACV